MARTEQERAYLQAMLRHALGWAALLGLITLVAVTAIVGIRDSYVPAPEVWTPCLDGTQCHPDSGFQPETANWGAALATGAITALLVALAIIAIRMRIATARLRAVQTQSAQEIG
jgi:hypothetical protein